MAHRIPSALSSAFASLPNPQGGNSRIIFPSPRPPTNLKHPPKEAEAVFELAVNFYRERKFDIAEVEFNRALQIFPDYVESAYYLIIVNVMRVVESSFPAAGQLAFSPIAQTYPQLPPAAAGPSSLGLAAIQHYEKNQPVHLPPFSNITP